MMANSFCERGVSGGNQAVWESAANAVLSKKLDERRSHGERGQLSYPAKWLLAQRNVLEGGGRQPLARANLGSEARKDWLI